ncbi:DNA-processing protein DprA [Naasia sp. SYSU D00948]|uniref:DNA-processing protein DprA n=1 Tax=Naasia sp. SYSU D00948 TaxID=2817379 RepID=UPI0027DD11F8|nr:DNA-processing protein DprA [Naasia sp. SYSU D00948]
MIPGIDERTARTAVAGVRPDTEARGSEAVWDLFARAAWSGIAEPGDAVAGTLIEALGAEGGLVAVIEGHDPGRLARELEEASGEPVGESALRAAQGRWAPRLVASDALRFLTSAAARGVGLLVPDDPAWPAGFADLGLHRPAALWFLGNPDLLRQPLPLAVVGARTATGYGEHVCAEAASGLAERGFSIVSGAAYGIDGMAHRAALAAGGPTVAFLAGGVDRFYPSGHAALLQRIAEAGAVVAELPCGSSPTRWRFLQRNRLIAAASLATIVVEAGLRSGSLNTAGHAAALGRPLGAVPGPVTSATSAGCHRLLREFDAVCVTNADEMAELVLGPSSPGPPAPASRDPEQERVLDALSTRPRTLEELARHSGLSLASVRAALGVLELEGLAKEGRSGWTRG